jgi:luciferase family oxidoreductase group 1
MLGSTSDGARLAAHFGLPFSFAHFINPDGLIKAVDVYRQYYRPTPTAPEPVVNLGVFALCADTRAEAEALARCRDVWRLRLERGEFGPIPTVAEAAAYTFSAAENARLESRRRHQILGTPDEVAGQLRALAAEAGASELAIVSITHEFAARARCYELIAGAMD